MALAPTRLRARECMAAALQGAVRPGRARTAPKENPCPPEKVAAIKQAFRRFGLILKGETPVAASALRS